jgi:hypothetical protein
MGKKKMIDYSKIDEEIGREPLDACLFSFWGKGLSHTQAVDECYIKGFFVTLEVVERFYQNQDAEFQAYNEYMESEG